VRGESALPRDQHSRCRCRVAGQPGVRSWDERKQRTQATNPRKRTQATNLAQKEMHKGRYRFGSTSVLADPLRRRRQNQWMLIRRAGAERTRRNLGRSTSRCSNCLRCSSNHHRMALWATPERRMTISHVRHHHSCFPPGANAQQLRQVCLHRASDTPSLGRRYARLRRHDSRAVHDLNLGWEKWL